MNYIVKTKKYVAIRIEHIDQRSSWYFFFNLQHSRMVIALVIIVGRWYRIPISLWYLVDLRILHLRKLMITTDILILYLKQI